MRHQRRDVVQGDLVHQIRRVVVRHLVEIYKDLNLVDVNLVHLVQEQIGRGVLFRVDQFFDQVAVVVQQNRDEQNLDVVQTLVHVVHLVDQPDVAVLDHRKFQMDYFQVVVDLVVVVVAAFVLQVVAVEV
jgi:hypothetical protein